VGPSPPHHIDNEEHGMSAAICAAFDATSVEMGGVARHAPEGCDIRDSSAAHGGHHLRLQVPLARRSARLVDLHSRCIRLGGGLSGSEDRRVRRRRR
jgi:hypothetical protein